MIHTSSTPIAMLVLSRCHVRAGRRLASAIQGDAQVCVGHALKPGLIYVPDRGVGYYTVNRDE